MSELILLEHWNFSPLLVLDVFINCEEEHEGKEETSATKKVPDVMPEEKNSFIRVCARKKNLHILPLGKVQKMGVKGKGSSSNAQIYSMKTHPS